MTYQFTTCSLCGSEFEINYLDEQLRCGICMRSLAAKKRKPKLTHDVKFRARLRAYDLEEEMFWALLEAQGNRCAICRREGTADTLCIDHNHATGRVRGLLCNQCNSGIGQLKEDPTILLAAIAYLKLYNETAP